MLSLVSPLLGQRVQPAVYTYTAYGLTIRLPFPCPALSSAPAEAIPDVTVADGVVPRELDAPAMEQPRWQAAPERFLWRGGRRSGRFLVEAGQRVTLQRQPAAEDEMLAFHFLDAVLAAILRQRGLLVLHATAAVTPFGAVAVSGESGAGKSTTVAALLARGCTLLADDITALREGSEAQVEALPGVPQLHLTDDAAAGLGQDLTGLPRYRWRRMKAAVPVSAARAAAPARLRALFVLRVGAALRLTLLAGVEKFTTLHDCAYGPLLSEEYPGQFPLFAAVAEQVAVYRLERPVAGWTADQVAAQILETGGCANR